MWYLCGFVCVFCLYVVSMWICLLVLLVCGIYADLFICFACRWYPCGFVYLFCWYVVSMWIFVYLFNDSFTP